MVANLSRELVPLVVVALVFLRPVTRRRVERFALRQRLILTVDNGPLVVRYLSLTRRWRVCGLLLGTLVAYAATYTQRAGQNFGGAGTILGWFAGALAAEWWVGAGRGVRPAASLVARRLVDYLPRSTAGAAIGLNVATLGYAVGALAFGLGNRPRVAALAGLLLVLGAMLWRVARHVLDRPQPLAEPSVVAADDAVRSRTLHVLAGCAVGFSGTITALLLSVDGAPSSSATDILILMCALALPVIGLVLAVEPFAARRPTSARVAVL